MTSQCWVDREYFRLKNIYCFLFYFFFLFICYVSYIAFLLDDELGLQLSSSIFQKKECKIGRKKTEKKKNYEISGT